MLTTVEPHDEDKKKIETEKKEKQNEWCLRAASTASVYCEKKLARGSYLSRQAMNRHRSAAKCEQMEIIIFLCWLIDDDAVDDVVMMTGLWYT